MPSKTVSHAVTTRRSVRAFLDTPVTLETIRTVLDKARWAPSGCNFQPWEATVLAGDALRGLQEKIRDVPIQDPAEYSWSDPDVLPDCLARYHQLGAELFGSVNVERYDVAGRDAFTDRNRTSFDAPALMLVYFPRVMGPPQWSDVGMWLQTIMLLLREEGLDSCPQEFLSLYARIIKDFLGVSDESHIFFCGLAIGVADLSAPINHFTRHREPLDNKVRFLGF